MSRNNGNQSSPETLSCAVLFPREQTLGLTRAITEQAMRSRMVRPSEESSICMGPPPRASIRGVRVPQNGDVPGQVGAAAGARQFS